MIRLRCLHGFLGAPKDFSFLRHAMASRGVSVDLVATDLFRLAHLSMQDCVERLVAETQDDEVLLGYSMGGRLAMQVFGEAPHRFTALVVVSAGTGGLNDRDARKRIADDMVWAERFRHEPWEELMSAWNKRAAFSGMPMSCERLERDYEREALARVLEHWSVGHQPASGERLAVSGRPILWMAGEKDSKYVDVARQAARQLPTVQLSVIEGAGHRVPWERPERFADELAAFLSSVQ